MSSLCSQATLELGRQMRRLVCKTWGTHPAPAQPQKWAPPWISYPGNPTHLTLLQAYLLGFTLSCSHSFLSSLPRADTVGGWIAPVLIINKEETFKKEGLSNQWWVTIRNPVQDLAMWRIPVTQDQSRSRNGCWWMTYPGQTLSCGPNRGVKIGAFVRLSTAVPLLQEGSGSSEEMPTLQVAPSPPWVSCSGSHLSPSTPVCSFPTPLSCHKTKSGSLDLGKEKVRDSGFWMQQIVQCRFFYCAIRGIFTWEPQGNGYHPLASLPTASRTYIPGTSLSSMCTTTFRTHFPFLFHMFTTPLSPSPTPASTFPRSYWKTQTFSFVHFK